MRILVCGGRDFSDAEWLYSTLDFWHEKIVPITCIIEGGATGADNLAKQWALEHGIPVHEFPADWSIGPKAGPLRNQRMIDEGELDAAIAFPGGRGTEDMVMRLGEARITLLDCLPGRTPRG